jgi:hypothetical protein
MQQTAGKGIIDREFSQMLWPRGGVGQQPAKAKNVATFAGARRLSLVMLASHSSSGFIATPGAAGVEAFAWFRNVLSRIATHPVSRFADCSRITGNLPAACCPRPISRKHARAPLVVRSDSQHSKRKRYYALRRTDEGRYLVAFTIRGALLRVISVRDMNRREGSARVPWRS